MRNWKRLSLMITPLLLALAGLITYFYFYSSIPTGYCDNELWNYVYHPSRLEIRQDCITVTGKVELVRSEPDGDYHIRLKLDDEYVSLVNERNKESQKGDLVVEPVCQHFTFYTPAAEACKDFDVNKRLHIPFEGAYVTMTGSYVLDKEHGWMEIHPLTSVEVDWIRTIFGLI